MNLPCPAFSIDITLAGGAEPDVSALPNRAGVFAFENESGQTICLAVTANLRRLIRNRLAPIDTGDENKPTRRVDYHALAKRIKALPVASSFEADWAYLQLARELAPHAAKSLTDQWRGWFVHIDPDAPFPRFVKTSTPGKPPTGENGIYLGPVSDKHAAARFIDALVAGFDLCRYYHVLIESPHGRACAYKEMGRCPAPCDGTVSMERYHEQVNDAVVFGCDRRAWRDSCRELMESRSAALEFEAAERCKRQLADIDPAMKPAFEFVDRLERFQWVAVTHGERRGTARMTIIACGWIAPFIDVPLDAPVEQLHDVAAAIDECIKSHPVRMSEADVENIGLVCMHFFRPRKSNQPPMVFVKAADGCDAAQLFEALQSIGRKLRKARADDTVEPSENDVTEQAIETI